MRDLSDGVLDRWKGLRDESQPGGPQDLTQEDAPPTDYQTSTPTTSPRGNAHVIRGLDEHGKTCQSSTGRPKSRMRRCGGFLGQLASRLVAE